VKPLIKRPVRYPRKTGPLPERPVLERGAARELLTTWELLQDKALVDRHLAKMDKLYGEGAEQRIRAYMRQIRRDERIA
jgi:hypothetical protein